MEPENELIKSMTNLQDRLMARNHELDSDDQKNLLEALKLLINTNETLRIQLQTLAAQQLRKNPRQRKLRLVK